MGTGKKARSKAHKLGKAAVEAQLQVARNAVAKALACTPEAMAPFLAAATEDATDSDAAAMTLKLKRTPPPPQQQEQEEKNGDDGEHERVVRFEYHTPATLPQAWREPLFGIFEGNMEAEYRRNWGYRQAEKRAEIFHKESRYLVAVEEGEEGRTPVGFLHIRFVVDEEDEAPSTAAVLYIYEIQLAPGVQRRGLGRRMMALAERMAGGLGLRKMKLTVFKTNAAATDFYVKRLGYLVDPSSPSKWGVEECYEILSKELTGAAAAAATAAPAAEKAVEGGKKAAKAKV